MDKIWFILIRGKQEGPYNFYDLRNDLRVTPDTLAWKEGEKKWRPIRKIPELKDLFKDPRPSPVREDQEKKPTLSTNKEELAIDMREQPPFLILLLVAIIVLSYVLYKMYS